MSADRVLKSMSRFIIKSLKKALLQGGFFFLQKLCKNSCQDSKIVI